jgi:hypothetical protein
MPQEVIDTAATPGCSYLFNVNEGSKKRDKTKKETYVHNVMQLLYLSQQARPDIQNRYINSMYTF